MESKLRYLGTKLPILAQERQQKIFAWKAENLITREEFIRYGKSEFIRGVKTDLDALVRREKAVEDFTVDRLIQIRDYLMMMLCVANALRASNLLYFSILVINVLVIYFKGFLKF